MTVFSLPSCSIHFLPTALYTNILWGRCLIHVGTEGTPIPLVVSDATALPFPEGTFDVVLSSGMIEHVGVDETSSPYTVHPRPEKTELRRRAIKEMVRATTESGRVLLDFPNGSFPIDFWHGDKVGAFRVHRIPDAPLPSFGDLRKWARSARSSAVILPLSGRLKFRQVGRHLWGRLATPLMRLMIGILDAFNRVGMGRLVAPLYPYLVVELRKESHAQHRVAAGR